MFEPDFTPKFTPSFRWCRTGAELVQNWSIALVQNPGAEPLSLKRERGSSAPVFDLPQFRPGVLHHLHQSIETDSKPMPNSQRALGQCSQTHNLHNTNNLRRVECISNSMSTRYKESLGGGEAGKR
jgi:hypothetical protein